MKQPLKKVAVFDSLLTVGARKETISNLATPIHNCNTGCIGAYTLGATAAHYFLQHGGSELNLLSDWTAGLCRSCNVRFKAGYFITKENREK